MVKQIEEHEIYRDCLKYLTEKGPPYILSENDFDEFRQRPLFTEPVESLLLNTCEQLEKMPDVTKRLANVQGLPIEMRVDYLLIELRDAGFPECITQN